MAELMENEVVRAFSTYAVIVVVKMLLMGPMTGYYRFTRGVSSNASMFYILGISL